VVDRKELATFWVTIEGQTQGKFKGSGSGHGPAQAVLADKITGVDFRYDAGLANGDPLRGHSGARRQHSPVVLTKAWDAATPQIYSAFAANEHLVSVLFEFLRTTPGGAEEIYQTIELKDATVSHVRYYLADGTSPRGASDKHHDLEDIAFTFDSIEIENKPGQTIAADYWA